VLLINKARSWRSKSMHIISVYFSLKTIHDF
jgi:hypothetical protein